MGSAVRPHSIHFSQNHNESIFSETSLWYPDPGSYRSPCIYLQSRAGFNGTIASTNHVPRRWIPFFFICILSSQGVMIRRCLFWVSTYQSFNDRISQKRIEWYAWSIWQTLLCYTCVFTESLLYILLRTFHQLGDVSTLIIFKASKRPH
jgi:hypothetical protein